MTAKSNFVICQTALGMHIPQGANAVNNESVILYGRLEALQAIPWMRRR